MSLMGPLIRPCPIPVMAAAFRDVEAATLALDGPPPITRTFPTCRAHYPGGSSGCACRLLPRSCSLPQMAGGSASALSLSRCYGASGEDNGTIVAPADQWSAHAEVERPEPIPHPSQPGRHADRGNRDESIELARRRHCSRHRAPSAEEA